jgi:hypothetical protein
MNSCSQLQYNDNLTATSLHCTAAPRQNRHRHLGKLGMKSAAVGIVSKNPEKSKHLETATMHLLGFSIDFVNLRTESYTSDSRIPHMGIGTPEDDAYRRCVMSVWCACVCDDCACSLSPGAGIISLCAVAVLAYHLKHTHARHAQARHC